MPRPQLITYRYNGTMAYVVPANSFEEGVQSALLEFEELRAVDLSRIAICVNGVVCGKRQLIRVGPAAWNPIMDALSRYEILDILVKPSSPEIVVTTPNALLETLPKYEDVKKDPSLESFLAPSRGPSPLSKNSPLPDTHAPAPRSPRTPTSSRAGNSSNSRRPKKDWTSTMSLFGRRD